MVTIRLFLSTFIAAILFSACSPCPAQAEDKNLEFKVKAAYVLNIIKFIDWENEKLPADTPIKIALAGDDPISDLIEKMANTRIGSHSLVIERAGVENIDAAKYHLLFIGRSEKQGLTKILKQLKGGPVLTVSDIPDFAKNGGIIGFVIVNDRVKIEINMTEAKRAGLKIGAKLLEVAKIIK